MIVWAVGLAVTFDERQLRFYEKLPVDLVAYYRSKGLNVVHINASNMRKPPLSDQHLKEVWEAYQHSLSGLSWPPIAPLALVAPEQRYVTSNLKKADGLFIEFGQVQQFDEIHSPFARFRLGNERLRTRQ